MDHPLSAGPDPAEPLGMRLPSLLTAALLTTTMMLVPAGPTEAAPVAGTTAGPGPIRIMPLGDSLTFGKGDRTENGYRSTLHTWLTASGVDADFVGSQSNGTGADTGHEGHPGWRIAWITRHVDFWMATYQPQVVLLDIGTNDLLHAKEIAGSPQRLNTLLDRIVAADPDVRIVLAKLLVVGGRHRKAFTAFNATLAKAAARHRDNITLVDMSRIPASDTVDGVHPNSLGYRKMSYQWFQGLRRVVPAGRGWYAAANPFTASKPAPLTVRKPARPTASKPARLTAGKPVRRA